MPGKYFDTLEIGETFRHQPHRTVTETDNLLMTTLTHNPQPLHLDAEYAAGTEFGRVVVNGLFTFSLMVGLSVGDTRLGTLIANLGYDEVKMPTPVCIGDTLRAETTVLEKRASKSRENAGIAVFEHRMFNQRGELVCHCKRVALLQNTPA